MRNDHRYSISLFKEDGAPLGQVAAEVDFEPAEECTRFAGARSGLLSPGENGSDSRVEPVWNRDAGEPLMSGFRVSLTGRGRQTVSREFPLEYFTSVARRASTAFVDRGLLKAGEFFRYRVSAVPGPQRRPEAPAAFSVEEVSPALPVKAGTRLRHLMQDAEPQGAIDGDDFPVVVPRLVLDEAVELTREAGARETGGVLIGHLHQDADTPELFLEVTAQIPARHTQSELTRLTFTADTWTTAQAAINLRRADELMVGWWHSHSYMKETCKDCEKRREQSCKAGAAFMSGEDCLLHRTVFPRAYSVALVISDSPCSGVSWGLFGWKRGVVAARGFHVGSNARHGEGRPADDEGDSHAER